MLCCDVIVIPIMIVDEFGNLYTIAFMSVKFTSLELKYCASSPLGMG